jgi:hypothetical protein
VSDAACGAKASIRLAVKDPSGAAGTISTAATGSSSAQAARGPWWEWPSWAPGSAGGSEGLKGFVRQVAVGGMGIVPYYDFEVTEAGMVHIRCPKRFIKQVLALKEPK